MSVWKIASAAFIFAVAALTLPAAAEQKVFANPVYKSLALDWCKTWGADCGKPAADAFCAKQGYQSSVNFAMWENLGAPTRLIGTNQICDDPGLCDSFTKITCSKPDPVVEDDGDAGDETVTYNKPRAGGRRLDWCREWGVNCGKPAADYYCKTRGHNSAVGFKMAENIGVTRILKTNQKCTMPECDGFRYIICE